GQISVMLEATLSPAAVGWAMSRAPEDVPWQRVVNASGGCSTGRRPDMPPGLQQGLLEQEGVEFENGNLDLQRFRWSPEGG
ncbi:MAG: MGMT family protein, partial [Acidobacteria bacterium]|nr:MGMT family protein [Candidatus Polarisedimenticola svalbardensis]